MLRRLQTLAHRLVVGLLPAVATGGVAFGAEMASAGDVMVVRSGDAAPYVAASRAAIERLRNEGVRATGALLADIESSALAGEDAPALLIAVGTEAAVSLAERAPESATIVYCLVADPVRAGLASRRRTHGVSTKIPIERQVEIMSRVSRRVRTIGALYRSSDPSTEEAVASLRRGAPERWRIHAVDIDAHASIAEAIEAAFGSDVDMLWTSPERSIYTQSTLRQVLLTSLRTRTPVFGFSGAFVRAGALVGVSVEPEDQGARAGEIALGLRRQGSEAGAERHEPAAPRIVLNRVVAETLGLRLPSELVDDADEVIGAQ